MANNYYLNLIDIACKRPAILAANPSLYAITRAAERVIDGIHVTGGIDEAMAAQRDLIAGDPALWAAVEQACGVEASS